MPATNRFGRALFKQCRIMRLPVLLAIACLSVPGFAAERLAPYSAEYKVRISVLGGKLTTRLETTDAGYFAESEIHATGMSRLIARGSIREKSWFAESDGAIRPIQYRSADTLSSDEQMIDLDFNWSSSDVTGLINGEDFHANLAGEVHDRVSVQYGLMYDLLNDQANGEYLLQDAEELKVLQITNIGKKSVKVPFGTYTVLGIQHQRVGSSRVTTLWCAVELGYLPIVIEQHRDGKLGMRAELTNFSRLTETVAGS